MNKKAVQYGLGGVAVALFIGLLINVIVQERLEDLESVISLQQEQQLRTMSVIAETTARNGADTVTESIVLDCSTEQRNRFDTLLGQLDDGLNRSELVELERLFASCGSFFSERKSLMVARLEREYEQYVALTEQLEAISGISQAEDAQIQSWGDLVRFEQQQNEHFASLVQLQEEIISALLAGNSTESEEIQSILVQVRETQENLALASTQAATARAEVLSL